MGASTIIEQRRFERLAAFLDVRLLTEPGADEARTRDISVAGCYIATSAAVNLRAAIDFELRLPSGHWIRLRGLVMHHYPGVGFGVRFEFSSPAQEKLIARLVEQIKNGLIETDDPGPGPGRA